jgi:hypothetical protein
MTSGDAARLNERIDGLLRDQPPIEGGSLEGWVAFSEWTKPDGESVLMLLGMPQENPTQLKGYVHSGLLNMAWGTFRPDSDQTRTT